MKKLFGFLATIPGRIVRAVAGLALILLGLLVVEGAGGVVIAVIGLVPLLAGLFDVCVISRLTGGPFKGSEIRSGK